MMSIDNTADLTGLQSNEAGIGVARRKPLIRAYHVLDADAPIDKNGYTRAIVDARIYMSASRNASNVYAAIWIHAGDVYGCASGSAGGWGYDKESAAIGDAITRAGVTLEHRIDGVGETAVRGALLAIAKAAGAARPFIVEAYA